MYVKYTSKIKLLKQNKQDISPVLKGLREAQGDKQLQCSVVSVRTQGHLRQNGSGGTSSRTGVEKTRQGECCTVAKRHPGELLT